MKDSSSRESIVLSEDQRKVALCAIDGVRRGLSPSDPFITWNILFKTIQVQKDSIYLTVNQQKDLLEALGHYQDKSAAEDLKRTIHKQTGCGDPDPLSAQA